ncbi:hypothetical protein BH11PLA1_BH11PLA1_13850 [soil metagenome]
MGLVPIFTALVGWGITFAIVGLFLWMFLRRKWDLVNFNTIFLVGFMQFYSIAIIFFSVADTAKYFENYTPPPGVWDMMSGLMLMFIPLYLVGYRAAAKWEWPQRLLPKFDAPVSYSGVLLVIGVMASGVLVTTGLGFASYGEFFAIMVRPAMASFAVGLAVVLVIKQPGNILFWGMFAVLFVMALLVGMTFQSGRRDALGAFLAALWVAYWGWLRYRPVSRQLGLVSVLSFVALVFLFTYTNIRGLSAPEGAGLEMRAGQLQDIASGKINPFASENVVAVLYQDACIYTCYAVEEYPRTHPLIPFQGLGFFVTNPLPRIFWEDKPVAMGIQMQKHLNAGGNLGIGIIGHGWIELEYLGVVMYALFFGMLYRVMDEALKRRAGNPYFIAAMGTGLGHMLALPRGEVSLFLLMWCYGFGTLVVMMFFIKLMLGSFMGAAGFFTFGIDDPKNNPGAAGGGAELEEFETADAVVGLADYGEIEHAAVRG